MVKSVTINSRQRPAALVQTSDIFQYEDLLWKLGFRIVFGTISLMIGR